jgi:hypothetical protein
MLEDFRWHLPTLPEPETVCQFMCSYYRISYWHSADRLVMILSEEFLPFFRFWHPTQPTRNADLIADVRHAHRLWSVQGMIVELEDDQWAVESFR